ncbi:unnamed protein product [Clonostachys chloroleuca]|uniref:F-box domain-containing protein n=1 Tax=Clonostachys chloroleuca TaxID=1926264 RepID=A0AA35LWF7_9HYPO|nr:unnamed protein product [Clonostachys chloroleuca]
MDNPNAQCPILQLDSDAFCVLASELPDHAKVLLSQTCRGIRRMLQNEKIVPALSAPEHVRLLVHLSRGNPNVWACAECKKQHPVTKSGFQRDSWFSSCPNRRFLRRREGVFNVNYARVQLALKYSRFAIANSRIRSYLDSIMEYESDYHSVEQRHSREEFEWSSRPRVIDGRFLVKHVWDYRMYSASSRPSRLPLISVCNHQRLKRPPEGIVWGEEREQLVRAVQQALSDNRKGIEYCGSCTFCPTDFSVRIFDDGMYVEAWKDFGPEDGPSNPTWASHRLSEAQRTPSDRGSVRRLYYEIH